MDETAEKWRATLGDLEASGFRLLPLDHAVSIVEIHALTEQTPPQPVLAFAQIWNHKPLNPLRAVVSSAIRAHPDIVLATEARTASKWLRPLVDRANHAALVWAAGRHPPQWAYLLQVRDAENVRHLWFYPPATSEDVRQAEIVLDMQVPSSYRQFLMLTNGLGEGIRESRYVCGMGPARSQWNAVLLNLWMECGNQHEVTATWREFQGTYAYERIMDGERGEDTFRSDETKLVPFAHTYETWCFDRSRCGTGGEYPIVLWDHEMREASDAYPDFGSWLEAEILSVG